MKTLVADGRNGLSVREAPMPEIAEYQALVKVKACGVCNGTDGKLIHGTFKNFSTYPAMLGHEAVGEVVEVGSKVRRFHVGDLVLLPFLEEPVEGLVPGWGGFSEYAVAGDYEAAALCGRGRETEYFNEGYHAQTVAPPGLSPVEAVMIITFREVLSAIRRFDFQYGKDVAVFGAGPVGLSFIKFANLLGMRQIIALDVATEKLEEAAAMGASHVLDARDPGVVGKIRKLCPGGLDYVVDAAGVNGIINTAMELVKYNGKICCYGISPQLHMDLDWSRAPYNWTLQFVQWPSKLEEAQVDSTIRNWMGSGALQAEDFISDILPFDRVLEAFSLLEERKIRKKMIITFD